MEDKQTMIGFSAALDDVPHETARLLQDVAVQLGALSIDVDAVASELDIRQGDIDFMSVYKQLANSKLIAEKLDERLRSVLVILARFYEHKMAEAAEPTEIDEILEDMAAEQPEPVEVEEEAEAEEAEDVEEDG
jgi:hypothetical protein